MLHCLCAKCVNYRHDVFSRGQFAYHPHATPKRAGRLTSVPTCPRLSRLAVCPDCERIMSAQNGPLEAGAGKESSVEDRRGATRYPLSLQTTGHVLGPRGNVPWVARITDISATGI